MIVIVCDRLGCVHEIDADSFGSSSDGKFFRLSRKNPKPGWSQPPGHLIACFCRPIFWKVKEEPIPCPPALQ